MSASKYFSAAVRSTDPVMERALQNWLGLYEFNHALSRAWTKEEGRMKTSTETSKERVAEGPAHYGIESAKEPLPEHLFRALAQGACALNEIDANYLVGGGVAANYHGQKRATRDVDFFILEDKDRLAPIVAALTQRDLRPHLIERPSFMPPDALFWWVPLQYGMPDAAPVDVDLLVANHEFMGMLHATGIESRVNDVRVRVLGPEGLVVLKLQAFRDKDRWDAKEILKACPALDRGLLETWVAKFKLEERLAQMEREMRAEGGRRFG